MSNQLVGSTYQRVISDVIESSQIDFEEGGVDIATLEELKKVWQEKLSSLQVAQFPWDPTPVPGPPPILHTPTVPSNANGAVPSQPAATVPASSNGQSASAASSNHASLGSQSDETKIKLEPQDSAPLNPGLGNPQAAAQRAVQQIQDRFGSRGSNSIEAGMGIAGPKSGGPVNSQGATSLQQQQRNGVNGAQTDGAGDAADAWAEVVIRRNSDAESEAIGRVRVDSIIRQHVESMGERMEGGGLMVPLSAKAALSRRRPSKKALGLDDAASKKRGGVGGFDGVNEDSDDEDEDDKANVKQELNLRDEDDEDAINSDLDDPDENVDSDQGDDDNTLQIMLCMYDKVQRVKNKWKCTLKDGVLNVNNREYVFSKATGDFEW
ncbi:MAG: hypothetical protein M1825_001951 [Sarcosagium campestre]|nr:MAG: hypothetical protein M1825_001951 [Sarcosagium campestre]